MPRGLTAYGLGVLLYPFGAAPGLAGRCGVLLRWNELYPLVTLVSIPTGKDFRKNKTRRSGAKKNRREAVGLVLTRELLRGKVFAHEYPENLPE